MLYSFSVTLVTYKHTYKKENEKTKSLLCGFKYIENGLTYGLYYFTNSIDHHHTQPHPHQSKIIIINEYFNVI